MKKIIQILILGFGLTGFSQSISSTISDHLKKEISKDYRKEIDLELSNAFQKAKDQHLINLNSADTLYLIRGIDIQTREAYGRIWNDEILLHYTDTKKPQKNKIMTPNLEISNIEKDNVTEIFNSVIKCIEKEDDECVQEFAEKNKVLSGVTWNIFRVFRSDGKYIVHSFIVPDFDTYK